MTDYECPDCGSAFDVVFYDEEDEVKFCPCCGAEIDVDL